MLTAALDAMAARPAPVVLAVAALLLFLESGCVWGLALPGTTLLVGLGLWAHTAGALAPAIAVAATATVAGAHHGWWRGRQGRGFAPLIARRAEVPARWLAARGPVGRTALLAAGHWAAALRPILPRVAGRAGVPYRVAGPALAVAGTAWAATLVTFGAQVSQAAGWVPFAVVGALLLTIGGRQLVRRASTSAVEPVSPSRGKIFSTL